jgi:hypothetical protein
MASGPLGNGSDLISDDVSQEHRHKFGTPNISPKDMDQMHQELHSQKILDLNDFISALKSQLYVVESEKAELAEKLSQEREKVSIIICFHQSAPLAFL